MRDGITLAADIYINPEDPLAPRPVLLQLSPYGMTATRNDAAVATLRSRGYNCVCADCRGRINSEGDMAPFSPQMTEDAWDLLEWISSQPWCNGKVIMVGGSYPGHTQLACLRSGHPALAAISPSAVTLDPYPIHYCNGAQVLAFVSSWFIGICNRRPPAKDAMSFNDAIKLRPLYDVPSRMGLVSAPWQEVIREDGYTQFWKDRATLANMRKSKAGVFYQGSWFDMLGADVFESFKAICSETDAETADSPRKFSCLRVGPWSHGVNTPEGETDFGPAGMVTEDAEIDFLDSIVQGKVPKVASNPSRMQIFVMGRNEWRFENEWPLARTRYTNVYLTSGGTANTAAGTGRLSIAEPASYTSAPSDSFVFDPANPVPTNGGRIVHAGGQRDQSEIEKRSDVLVYTGAPLADELEVTGEIKAVLFVSSTAPDTDFTVKLVDLYPDGRAMSVCDGIMRVRFRDGLDKPARLMTPGEHVRLEFKVDITSYCFMPGHSVRIEISSSNFPHFAVNPNTGREVATDTEMHPALQTLWHTAEEASHIILPVIPK